MKALIVVTAAVTILAAAGPLRAERALDRQEVLQIFQDLTAQPRRTWIPAGVISASRRKYEAPKVLDEAEVAARIRDAVGRYQADPDKPQLTADQRKMYLDAIPFNVRYELANASSMDTTVLVRYDGESFYWRIDVDSRTDSVQPGPDLAGNFMLRNFDLRWNSSRIAAWNGQEYTTYSLPGNQAIIDATAGAPHPVNGPLTAGVTPWGHGRYTYDELAAAQSSAVETYADGRIRIDLSLTSTDGLDIFLALDPEMDYAVLFRSITGPAGDVTTTDYFDYAQVGGRWVPGSIVTQRHEAVTGRVLLRDAWTIESVTGAAGGDLDFEVDFEPDAYVEYFSDVSAKSVSYRHSEAADAAVLLTEKIALEASAGMQARNCATVAVGYAASRLGRDVGEPQLAQLVSADGTTSMPAMKDFLEQMGLYCRAVATDVEALADLGSCQAILHIPGTAHFVVLDRVDAEYVWLVDLTGRSFYRRVHRGLFGMDWTAGTALLVSDEVIDVQGRVVDLDAAQLAAITGADGYSCTRLLQEYRVYLCVQIDGECGSIYTEYYERWGCEAAPSGSCSNQVMVRVRRSPCIEDPADPLTCIINGEWQYYYMLACG